MTGKIYIIRNLVNGKGYVGQTTKTLFFRFNQHKYDAFIKKSGTALHKALRKYGPKNFEIFQLVECNTELLDTLEKFFIKFHGTYASSGHGYNLTKGGDGSLEGRVFTPEGRASLAFVHKGNSYAKGHTVSAEAKAKMSEAHKGKGKPVSEEQKKKISETLKGHPVSEETRKKISDVQRRKKRGPLSEEAKRKLSIANTGRKYGPLTPEQKLQRSITMKRIRAEQRENRLTKIQKL